MLAACSAMLMASEVRAENLAGIEWSECRRSNSASCNAYIMSNPPHHVMTRSVSMHGSTAKLPATARYAPTGAMPSDRPSTRCARGKPLAVAVKHYHGQRHGREPPRKRVDRSGQHDEQQRIRPDEPQCRARRYDACRNLARSRARIAGVYVAVCPAVEAHGDVAGEDHAAYDLHEQYGQRERRGVACLPCVNECNQGEGHGEYRVRELYESQVIGKCCHNVEFISDISASRHFTNCVRLCRGSTKACLYRLLSLLRASLRRAHSMTFDGGRLCDSSLRMKSM